MRAPNSYHTNTLSLPVQPNPGASGYDVQYGLGSPVNPDGSISGSPQSGYVNTTTGTIDLTFPVPGTYTVVYRAHNGDYGSPWSAPVNVVAMVPFDLLGISCPDSRGPQLPAARDLNDKNIRGRVSLAIARKGKHNKYGNYKSLGKASISSKVTFSKRFTERRTGTYRLRVHYAGSGDLAGDDRVLHEHPHHPAVVLQVVCGVMKPRGRDRRDRARAPGRVGGVVRHEPRRRGLADHRARRHLVAAGDGRGAVRPVRDRRARPAARRVARASTTGRATRRGSWSSPARASCSSRARSARLQALGLLPLPAGRRAHHGRRGGRGARARC